MAEPQKDDETKFNETLKRMLNTPPKPQKDGPARKPDQKEKSKE